MIVKNLSVAMLLAMLPFFAEAFEYSSSSDCSDHYTPKSSKWGKIRFPSNQNCIKAECSSDQYLTDNHSILLKRGYFEIWAEQVSRGNDNVRGLALKDYLFFFVSVPGKSEEGPYEYGTTFEYDQGRDIDEDEHTWKVSTSGGKVITCQDLEKKYNQYTQKHLSDLGDQVTIKFQYVTWIKIYRGADKDGDKYDRTCAARSNKITIPLMNCNSGLIGANTKLTPKIIANDEESGTENMVYAIYPTWKYEETDNCIQTTNVQNSGSYNLNNYLYFTWSLSKKNSWTSLKEINKSIKTTEMSDLDIFVNFQYKDLGNYKTGSLFEVKRYIGLTNSYDGGLCATPAITFEIVPEAFLSEKGVNPVKVCPKKEKMTFSGTNEYHDPDWMYLKGENIKFRDSDNRIVSISDAMYDAYGIKYGWEYSTDKENWITLKDTMNTEFGISPNGDFNYIGNFLSQPSVKEYDLLVPNNMFADGKTCYFRQVVTLENFLNRKIVSEKIHEVTPYYVIENNDFKIQPLGTLCADGTSQEVDLNVTFNQTMSSDALAGYKWVSNDAALQFNCSFLENEEEYKGMILNATYNVFSDTASAYDANITVTDGCGTKVDLKETLTFEEQPKLDPNNVICTNATYEYNELQNQVEIVIPEGVIGYLNIDKSDNNYSTSQYLYSTNGHDYEKISSHGVEILLTSKSEQAYFIKKKSNRGHQCESDILNVLVKRVGALVGNHIDKDTLYVCKGSRNPLITGGSVSGGFGEGATLSYLWIYSYDDTTYTAMIDGSSKTLTDSKVEAGTWNQVIDKKVYIRRIATSKKGAGVMSDTSAAFVVMPYSDPMIELNTNTYVCYGDTVILSGSVDADFTAQIEKTNTAVNYWYAGGKNKNIFSSTSLSPYPIIITKDTIVYVNVDFCGKTVSSKGTSITSGANLKPMVKEGDCRVRGKKMEVSVVRVNADYTYKINGVEGYTTEIDIPKSGGFEYNVTVNDSKCEKTFTYEIEDGKLQDSLRHFELAVDGSKLADGQKVCAGIVHSFANIQQESIDNIANNYTWYVDGKSQSYSNNASFNFMMPTPGKTYTVLRKSEEIENGNTCQSILDSIKVVTYDNISGAVLTADKETVCYGNGVSLTISGMKGASEAEYKYTIYDGSKQLVSKTVGFGKSDEEYIDRLDSAGMHNLYAVVRDTSICHNNETYSQKTDKIQLYQAETAEFKLTASPSVIEEDAGLTKVVITPTAENGDKVTTDNFTYWYTTDKGTIKDEAEGNFSISVSGSDFSTNGILTINVERTVSGTGCTANNSVTITQTAGFEDQPSILCDAAKDDDQAEVCGGSEVKLSIAALPSYGLKVLTSKDVTYSWYRNGEWQAEKDSIYMATAKAGDTSVYQCKISYLYDAAMKPAYIFSHEFKLIGKKGVVLGNVYQQSDRSRSMAVCVGSDKEITLNVDADLDIKDEISWLESKDGTNWTPIAETNIKEQVETTLVLKTSYYTGAKGKYYFRVKGTSDCGSETYSKSFTLEVEDLPTAPEVALRSSNVINGTINSLNFSPKNSYAGYRYEWGVSEDDMPFFSTGGAHAIVDGDFAVGDNTIYVRKVSTTGGHCASAVTSYDFKLYEELSIGDLMATTQAKVRCPNENKHTLQISGVNGGSGEYAITWQYKSDEGDWISFSNTSSLPFKFSIEDPVKLAGGTIFQFIISEGLSTTTTFRAIVSSTGDYKGAAKYSTEYKIEYYEPLKDEGIDISETLVCYGMTNDRIIGKATTGGNVSSPYQYQWYKTTNRDSDLWEAIPSATLQNYTKRDTLYETTFYKRVVTDGCGSTLESVAKRVGVNDIVEIKAEDIRYDAVVSDGNVATMWGMPNGEADASQYVWYNEAWQTLDTTKVRELYVTKNSLNVTGINQHSKLFVYYAKKYLNGCLSYNSDTLYITASKNTSGNIFINAENEDNFWVCSGTTDIEILSESNPLNAKRYVWYYRITEHNEDDEPVTGNWKPVGGINELYATGKNINLDTCNLERDALKNAKGRKKIVELKRIAEFEVAGNEVSMESNVVAINIVPTMTSNPLTLTSITGTISSDKIYYCKGDIAEPVYGDEMDPSSVVLEIWRNPNKYFGPGLYDPEYEGGIYTWFEYSVDGTDYDTVRMINSVEDNDFARSFYPGEGIEGLMNQTYYVRRGVSDGCSSVYSNKLVLSVSDEVGSMSSISMFALEPGKTDIQDRMSKGFEFGDSLVVWDSSREAFDCKWSLDSTFKDTFETNKQFVGFTIDENVSVRLMDDPNIYMKRKSKKSLYEDCWSSSLQIPVAVGTASKGGLISENQKVCFGADFKGIDNIEVASGEWISPKYAEMKWTYRWQWSQDSVKWVDIENSDSIGLSAKLVNTYVDPLKLMTGKTTYFRRVATNDSSRVRYSNVAVLSYFDEMKPGVLSDDQDGKTGYCTGDDLPVISTTEPTGGTFEENGINYTWKLSIDGGEYVELSTKKTTLDLAFEDTIYNQTLNKNVKVSVICEYSDGKLGCGTVESEPLDYVLYRRNDAPGIYQDNDSCDAQTVVVKVVPEKIEKTYIFGTFVETENGDSITWESEATEKTIKRVTTMIVDEYGVFSIDNETGCQSETTKFNVDSLPDLNQGVLEAPATVCYGEDYTVKGGTISGGNGTKTFIWQYSYDDVEWETLSDQSDEDLEVVKPKYGISYRRIVSDMCGVDTSNAVHIDVREKIDVTKDVLVFNDFKCANRKFNINTAEGVVFTDNDYYTVWNSSTHEIFDTKNMTFRTIDEFEGDSLEMRMAHVIVDTTGMICKSEEIKVYAHHSVALDSDANHISCDNITPCNGRYVEIEGESQNGPHADKINYKWYVSNDNQTWKEELKQGKDLALVAEDTMFIRRIANNGCESDTSNVVTIFGTKVEQYDYEGNLALEIISDMQDSSVSMVIERGKDFDAGYYFEGNGVLPVVSSNITVLPYNAEMYKDSILMLIANSDHCVSAYRINPLRGGVISFDGDSMICGSAGVPPIVVTELEGGLGNASYQWQYKNERTPDFISIEGATEKSYTPSAIDVATTYRRVATDGVYKSISNELTLSIRPLPSVAQIESGLSEETMKEMGLVYKQHEEYQWIPNAEVMEMYLVDSAYNADHTYWQKSYNQMDWQTESTDNDSMLVADTTSLVYYRYIAESACGADTSSFVKLFTANIDPITDDQIDWTNTDTFVCLNDSKVNCLRFGLVSGNSNNVQVAINNKYLYSYKVECNSNVSVWCGSSKITEKSLVDYSNSVRVYEMDSTGNRRLPSDIVTLYVTRHDTARGLSVTRPVTLKVDAIDVTFAMSIENKPAIKVGENGVNQISQGDRVQFIPVVSSNIEGEMSYKWVLEEPLNLELSKKYGGRNGLDGLTSEIKSPSCYYYNGGYYPISLTVSDGFCQQTVRDTSLYISESSLRSFNVSMALADDWSEYGKEGFDLTFVDHHFINIFPTLVTDFVTVSSTDKSDHNAMLIDELGRTLLVVSFNGSVQISMNEYISGTYFIVVDNKENFKIIKKQIGF